MKGSKGNVICRDVEEYLSGMFIFTGEIIWTRFLSNTKVIVLNVCFYINLNKLTTWHRVSTVQLCLSFKSLVSLSDHIKRKKEN